MNQPTDVILNCIHELIRAVSQGAAGGSGFLFPEILSSKCDVFDLEEDDISFDDRGRFLEPKNRNLPALDDVSLASAQGAGMNACDSKPVSSGEKSADIPRAAEHEARSFEFRSGDSGLLAPADLEDSLAELVAEVAALAPVVLANRHFHGVSEAACWVHLLANLETQIELMALRAVGSPMSRDAVLAHSKHGNLRDLVELVGEKAMNSARQIVCQMVNWHGGFIGEGEERVCPRQLHRRAFAVGETMCKSLWAGSELKNSFERIRASLETLAEARRGVAAARQGYRMLWEGASGFYAAAQSSGFGELELEWVSGQKFINLAEMEGLLDAVLVDLDWSEKCLNDALLEWEETKAELDQALRELKAGNLRQAELLQSKISHRFWLDLDVEAVCRELDAILSKHLAEVHALAARDERAALSLADRHAERYSHSPRIRKGFLKFKSSLQSEMLLKASSREKMSVGLSTLALYGAVAACAFAGGVFWFDTYLQDKASRSETLEKNWIEKISREQNRERSKMKDMESVKASDSSQN